MTKQEFESLESGDVVADKSTGQGYIIADRIGSLAVQARRIVVITSPEEWDLLRKDNEPIIKEK